MPLLTFTRSNPSDDVSVVDAVRNINRQLERKYPDCTSCLLGNGDRGTPAEWVTIELEITHQSLDCLEWYARRAAESRLALSDWKARRADTFALEFDLVGAFPA